MDVLDTYAAQFMSNSLSSNTMTSYNCAYRSFIKFQLQDNSRPLPLQEKSLIRYVCFLSRRLRYDSIKIYLSGIRYFALIRGSQVNFQTMHQLYYVLRGIRRQQAHIFHSNPKTPKPQNPKTPKY